VVLTNLLGGPGARPVSCRCEPLSGSTGAATGDVSRVTGVARLGTAELPFRLVRKAFRPLLVGRHAPFAGDPRHGAYWRREPLAYASDLLPTGPGLAAPRCYGVVDDVVHLVDVSGRAEAPEVAARRAGAWQATARVPAVGRPGIGSPGGSSRATRTGAGATPTRAWRPCGSGAASCSTGSHASRASSSTATSPPAT